MYVQRNMHLESEVYQERRALHERYCHLPQEYALEVACTLDSVMAHRQKNLLTIVPARHVAHTRLMCASDEDDACGTESELSRASATWVDRRSSRASLAASTSAMRRTS